ncbi:hypothetical protein BDZ89DRAFT_1054973 [Hymenopellis radicata]|nr:hypothetical protein BDZ89DRAFT_1054973 [Hymenopellis radicata]
MGQYFRLFNIDKCIYSEEVYTDASMDELHSDVFQRDLVRLLAAPTVPFPKDPLERKFQQTPCSLTLRESNANVATNLPPEIHAQILGHLFKYYDVLAFCMASQYCWTVGLRRLKALWAPFARKECGSWAGDRLIILGDWLEEIPSAIRPRDMVVLKRHYARMRKDALEDFLNENDFDDSDSEGWDFEGMVDDKTCEDKPLYEEEEETKRFTDPQLDELFKDWLHPPSL